MKHLGFNIVLLGMIASGKDTQAKILKQKYSLKSIESGAYWRRLMQENSKQGELLRATTGKGKPAPVALMKNFLINAIKEKPKNKDLLFLGNPRLKPEAQLLKKLLTEKEEDFIAFYISLPEKEVFKRSLARMRNIDDRKYIQKRIKWHKDQVGKTLNYFEKINKLKVINGNKSIKEVSAQIIQAIEAYKKAN